jgi:hypothetical protein
MTSAIFRLMSRVVLALVFLLGGASAGAQQGRSSDPKAFVLEAGSGSLGSLVGRGLIGLSNKCGVEDLACILLKVGAGGALGAVGATIGTSLAARSMNSPRSVAGAALGAVVGTGVGLGFHWLLNRSSDRNLGDKIVVPIFVVSQGIFAALGSRALGSRR